MALLHPSKRFYIRHPPNPLFCVRLGPCFHNKGSIIISAGAGSIKNVFLGVTTRSDSSDHHYCWSPNTQIPMVGRRNWKFYHGKLICGDKAALGTLQLTASTSPAKFCWVVVCDWSDHVPCHWLFFYWEDLPGEWSGGGTIPPWLWLTQRPPPQFSLLMFEHLMRWCFSFYQLLLSICYSIFILSFLLALH